MIMDRSDFCNFAVNWLPFPKIRRKIYSILGMKIHPSAHIMRNCQFLDMQNIQVGQNSIIGHNCYLDGRGALTIRENVNIGSFTKILTASHQVDSDGFSGENKPVIINDHVWIATGSIILPGVSIGRGAVIGAGSVVTREIPASVLAAGNPAKVIRQRKSSLQYQLYGSPSRVR